MTFKPMGNKLVDTFVGFIDGKISEDFSGMNEYRGDFRQKMAKDIEDIDG